MTTKKSGAQPTPTERLEYAADVLRSLLDLMRGTVSDALTLQMTATVLFIEEKLREK